MPTRRLPLLSTSNQKQDSCCHKVVLFAAIPVLVPSSCKRSAIDSTRLTTANSFEDAVIPRFFSGTLVPLAECFLISHAPEPSRERRRILSAVDTIQANLFV